MLWLPHLEGDRIGASWFPLGEMPQELIAEERVLPSPGPGFLILDTGLLSFIEENLMLEY